MINTYFLEKDSNSNKLWNVQVLSLFIFKLKPSYIMYYIIISFQYVDMIQY